MAGSMTAKSRPFRRIDFASLVPFD
jgi:hypothetical protein